MGQLEPELAEAAGAQRSKQVPSGDSNQGEATHSTDTKDIAECEILCSARP